ncbi:transcriptional regulator [Nonomuraea rhodomycinica]|uniref:Transcriptional regulator n=1 Tax=Nonomuraea rhodomycinica TaxID=1712872 RepID=A0A7Y6IQL2_9ACTN|nr:transcriptional regulator [Nonomuraea rhodomycinica]
MDPSFSAFLHVPARLSIVASLDVATWMEAGLLRDMVRISDSALREELSPLVQAGHAAIREGWAMGSGRTYVQVTPMGRRAFHGHVAALERLAQATSGDAARRGVA